MQDENTSHMDFSSCMWSWNLLPRG